MTRTDPRQQLRWLHLSDFHLKSNDKWSQDVVLRSLLTDISNRFSDDTPLDFIFITGDLAYSGKHQEYLIVEDFLHQLLRETRVSHDRLLMVPGNHDINRNLEPDAFMGAKIILKNSIEVDKFFEDEGRRRTLFHRQAAFREFANRLSEEDRYSGSSHQHSVQFNLQGLNISVLLVDSSWLSEGGESDSHSILVGERQLIDLSLTLPKPALAIALMHHPLDWLAPFEQAAIKNLLTDHCHLLFRGHVHEDSIETISSSGNHIKVFTAGASYESRLSANCYGYGFVDLHTGDGECVVHKYRNDSKTWEKQEPVRWTLTDQENFSIDFDDVTNSLGTLEPPYPNYLTCLVAQKVTEIPVPYGEQIVFLSFTDQIASTTLLAQGILQLRFLIHWKDCWDPDRWQDALQHTVASYSGAMTECSVNAETRRTLSKREEQCKKLVLAIRGPHAELDETNQTVLQALKLAVEGAGDLSVSILNRMLSQQGIPDLDTVSALRALTKILLAEGNDNEALKASQRLVSYSESTGADHLLAATCCLNAQDYGNAVKHLEAARELDVPFTQLKGIARRIAGLTGDRDLLARLGKNDV